jgi:hypothetical protein
MIQGNHAEGLPYEGRQEYYVTCGWPSVRGLMKERTRSWFLPFEVNHSLQHDVMGAQISNRQDFIDAVTHRERSLAGT